MKESLTRQGIDKKYTFEKPIPRRMPKVLNTLTGIKTAFGDPARFKVIYEKEGYGNVLTSDEIPK
jgi:linoleate 10R-lipoxygenase